MGGVLRSIGICALVAAGCATPVPWDLPDPSPSDTATPQPTPMRMQIDLTNPTGAAILAFNVVVVLNSSIVDYSQFASDGSDIRFFAGETGIPYEIEAWNPNGVSIIWVPMPVAPLATTSIDMRWGDPSLPAAAGGSSAIWTFCSGVWHMNQDLASDPQLLDSSPQQNHGSISGATAPVLADSQIGRGLALDDTPINVGDPANGSLDFGDAESLVISMWVQIQTSLGTLDNAFAKNGAPGGGAGYAFELGAGRWDFFASDGMIIENLDLGLEQDLLGDWVLLAAHVDRTNGGIRAYVNGSEVDSAAANNFSDMSNAFDAIIGGPEPFTGTLDEVRVCEMNVGPGFFVLDYLSTTNQLLTLHDPQPL